MNKVYCLCLALLKITVRNKSGLFWSIVFPLIMMLFFGLFNHGINRIRVGLAVGSGASRAMVARVENHLHQDNGLTLVQLPIAKAKQMLAQGAVDLVVNMTANHQLQFYVNRHLSSYSVAALYITKVKTLFMQSTPHSPQFVTSYLGPKQQYRYMNFLTPGIIALSVMNGILFPIVFLLLDFRQNKMLRRLSLTSLTRMQFFSSLSLSRIVIAIIQGVILLCAVWLLYGVHMQGSFFSFLIVLVIGALMFIMLGLLIASLLKDREAVVSIVNMITLPMIFLSGVFFSLSALPAWLSSISKWFPLTYFINALRCVYLADTGSAHFSLSLFGMVIWIAIFLGANAKFFKWD